VCVVRVRRSTIVDPYLNLFRGIIPPIGGTLDLSPILAFVVLNVFTGCAHCHYPFVYPCVATWLLRRHMHITPSPSGLYCTLLSVQHSVYGL
jgi:hypothetical protein